MDWKIPLFKIMWDENDVERVTEIVKRGSFWATGPEIDVFESKISDFVGTKYAVAFNSGTSALHSLLIAYGLQQGDEVIVPSFTFISTANAPLFVGAKPVFADIEEKTCGLDPESVKELITSKTKAIIPIHYAGCPCLIRELKEIAEDSNMLLIEDAAESLGASIRGIRVGNFGDSALLSFCQNKVITTGEGGAIVTDSLELYKKLRLLRSHGRDENENYFSSTDSMDYISIGYNFRISTLLAAIGISQIEKISDIIRLRREKADYFTKKLLKIPEIVLPKQLDGYFNIYQMYPIMVENNIRNDLMKYLSKRGVMTKIYFPPVHLTKFYKNKFGYDRDMLPVTEDISSRILSLPIYPTMLEEEQNYVVKQITEFFGVNK